MSLLTKEPTLPSWWHVKVRKGAIASGSWVRIRLSSAERATLLSTQRDWAALMQSAPAVNTAGKQKWYELRRRYAETRDPQVFTQLQEIGPSGRNLTEGLRTRCHAIRDECRKLSALRGCRPIYVHAFELAAAVVLDRLRNDEQTERRTSAEFRRDFVPSDSLWALANLYTFYTNQAANYDRQDIIVSDTLPPPRDALTELWPNIAALNESETKGKTK